MTAKNPPDVIKIDAAPLGVAISLDCKLLVACLRDGSVRTWDLATRQPRLTIASKFGVDLVTFSPDGKRLATASEDHTAKVWDAEAGKELLTVRGHSGAVDGVAFSLEVVAEAVS